jgi:hypothetical protein
MLAEIEGASPKFVALCVSQVDDVTTVVLSRLPASRWDNVVWVVTNDKALSWFDILFPAAVYGSTASHTRRAFNRFLTEVDNPALRAFSGVINLPVGGLSAVFRYVAATINIAVGDYLRSGSVFRYAKLEVSLKLNILLCVV